MKLFKTGFIVLNILLLTASSASAKLNFEMIEGFKNKVIYGVNNLRLTHRISDHKKRVLARSTALMVNRYSIKSAYIGGLYMMDSKPLGEKAPVCDDNPWKNYNALGSCSATLIAHDKILTAGHCIANLDWECSQKSFIFNAREDFFTRTINQYFSNDQIYHCKKVIAHKLDADSGMDYSIVQLDRSVPFKAPIRLHNHTKSDIDDEIFMIGHPLGLGSMTSEVGDIRSDGEHFYVANIDSFAGNSGAPVFRESDNSLTGMLVRGEEDFIWNSEKKCFNLKVCDNDSCRGEDIIKIEKILEDVRDQGIDISL